MTQETFDRVDSILSTAVGVCVAYVAILLVSGALTELGIIAENDRPCEYAESHQHFLREEPRP